MILNIERISRLHHLILNVSTGNPHQLADKLTVSEAAVCRDIKRMRRAERLLFIIRKGNLMYMRHPFV